MCMGLWSNAKEFKNGRDWSLPKYRSGRVQTWIISIFGIIVMLNKNQGIYQIDSSLKWSQPGLARKYFLWQVTRKTSISHMGILLTCICTQNILSERIAMFKNMRWLDVEICHGECLYIIHYSYKCIFKRLINIV